MKTTSRANNGHSSDAFQLEGSLLGGHLPLYVRLKETLLRQVEERKLMPGDPIPSERELCSQYGVSSITVRRALMELVNEGRIVRQAGIGSFVNSGHGRARLGVIVFGFDENDWRRNRDIFGSLIGGIASAVWERDAVFSLVRAPLDTDTARFFESHAPQKLYDGVLLCTAGDFSAPDLAPLHRQGIPFVLVRRSVDAVKASCVIVDEQLGGFLATQHLIKLGHRRIAFLGPAGLSIVRQRYRGYQQALEEAALEVDPDLVQIVPSLRQLDGYEGTKQLLARQRPTAIFASADVLAEGCYPACAEAGLHIPRDVSIVGHDDYSAATRVRPLLTTVHISHQDLGMRSTHLLLDRIRDADAAPRHEVLAPVLVVRESTACPEQS